MKLTPENIAKIEAVLTDWEEGHGQRHVIIDHNIRDTTGLAAWLGVMRDLGINTIHATGSGLTKEDNRAFVQWLREKRARENAERGL